jgi:hypothetical protein
MPKSNSKTYIVNDQPTEQDGLDFTPTLKLSRISSRQETHH